MSLVLALLLSACLPVSGDCPWTGNAGFVSVDPLPCGQGVTCNWTLSFVDGDFAWGHDEVLEEGIYSCSGDTLTGTTDTDTYSGTWDEAAQVLTWEGEDYW